MAAGWERRNLLNFGVNHDGEVAGNNVRNNYNVIMNGNHVLAKYDERRKQKTKAKLEWKQIIVSIRRF